MAYIPELIAFQETLASNYDLSTGTGTFTSADISEYNKFSLQFTCSGFGGTTQIRLEQSLDNTNWDIVENSLRNLDASTCEFTFQQMNWMSKYLRVNILTSQQGAMTIKLLAKR